MRRFLIIFLVVFTLAAVVYYPYSYNNALTFTDVIQTPSKTTEKFKNTWDDTTIIESTRPNVKFEDGSEVATVTIPALNMYELPVYYGSKGLNSDWQMTTPGYNEGWGMFGDKMPAALGSHNYQMFGTLPDINLGDRILVETDDDTYVYEVTEKKVFDHKKNNWAHMVNVAPNYSLILITCYPVDAMATYDRYMVYTKLIKGTIYK